MTPQEKYREIAVAFARFSLSTPAWPIDVDREYEQWASTEEGKRLTAEEPENIEQSAVEAMKAIVQSLTQLSYNQKKIADYQMTMNDKFDRFEGRLKGNLFGD